MKLPPVFMHQNYRIKSNYINTAQKSLLAVDVRLLQLRSDSNNRHRVPFEKGQKEKNLVHFREPFPQLK